MRVKSPDQIGDQELEVLLAMYTEQCDQARHYETQHLTVIGFVVATAGALTGLATFDDVLDRKDIPIAVFVSVVGVYGFLASLAYYMRSARHGKRAETVRQSLDERFPSIGIEKLRDQGAALAMQSFKPYGPFAKLRLHHIWFAVSLSIVVFGLLLLALAL